MNPPNLSLQNSPLLAAFGRNPSVAQIFEANTEFEQRFPELSKGLHPTQVSILSELTLHNIVEPLRYFSRSFGVEPLVEVLPPYQIEAFLLTGQLSETSARSRALVVIFDLEKMTRAHSVLPSESQRAEFETHLEQRLMLCSGFAQRAGCKVIVGTCFLMYPPLSATFTHRDEFARANFIDHANRLLCSLCADLKLEILPIHEVLRAHGTERCLSLKDYLASDSPFSAEGANRLSDLLARQLSAHFTRRRKVLVLDLDNTLWRGVLGEDGIQGIKYRPDCFEGRVFWHILGHIKCLAESGIVLAINSKNNEHEVLALLDEPGFPLKREDFAAIKANWLPKSQNLHAISEELGLSLDSMVMLDDSDAECLHLRQTLPEVEVVQVPKRLSEYPSVLAGISFFDRPRITEADTVRKLDYQNIQKRKKLAESTGSFDDFLKALGIEVTLSIAESNQMERLEQLFERTNQFNLSGKRYKQAELLDLQKAGALLITASYSDSFGSSGVIGALVARLEDDVCRIDNFVLSCRVLGRSVENSIVSQLSRAFFGGGPSQVGFEFVRSDRNVPAQKFLESIGSRDGDPVSLEAIKGSPHIRVVVTSTPTLSSKHQGTQS